MMTDYTNLMKKLSALLEETKLDISILANSSALLFEHLEEINWVGFYIHQNNSLYLGPFQGKIACTEIPFTKGVCGACATTRQTLMVPNVHEFSGHIACDSASNSEICIPIIIQNKLYAILDIDSPKYNRFNQTDKRYLEEITKIISEKIENIQQIG